MEALQQQLDQLSAQVYTAELKDAIEKLVADVPDPDSLPTAAEKVQALLIRGRARLLLPTFSKDAENDFNKALKFNQKSPATWVALSEAYWRRNSFNESRDAIESALRIDAKFQPALCQKSRLLRAMCNAQTDATPEQRHAWLAESVAIAKEAVGVNPNDGDSWASLGIAILQETVALGMDLPVMKKALAALNQAAKKCPHNPDVFYNRGVVHQCFGHFGSAIQDFMAAYALDPKGCRGAKGVAEELLRTLEVTKAKMVPNAGLAERDFKRNVIGKLPEVKGEGNALLFDVLDKPLPTKTVYVTLKVIDLIGSPTTQPLTYLCCDRESTFCLLMMYRTSPLAIKGFDTVVVPFPPSSGATLAHNIPKIDGLEGSDAVFATPTVVVEPGTLLVNGSPIPSKYCEMPQLKTRLFQ